MRLYELVTISPPAMSDQEIEQLSSEITGLLQAEGAELVRLDRWGRKRLAYPIHHHQEGLYLYTLFKSEGDVSNTIERKLRLREVILRLQIVRIDEDLRRAKTDVSAITPRLETAEPAAAVVEVEAEEGPDLGGEEIDKEAEEEPGAETAAEEPGAETAANEEAGEQS
jgi:small subunit ribosomal protein S6